MTKYFTCIAMYCFKLLHFGVNENDDDDDDDNFKLLA